ncbi:MAG: PKD domain-containing protein [Gammaproteobacteria bacterium]|nr:PKD domain-containing protein [Gammaproteobacteria bacterium]
MAGETLLLQIDIDAEKSIKYHETSNGEWRFRPVIFVESGDHDDFGRLVLSDADPDVLKTVLIVLDLAPSRDEVLRGEISTLNDGGFTLITDMGDRCVATDDDTEVFLILPDDGNGIRSERGTLGDLATGQSVDVYGEEENGGCFEAETVIVDLTADVVTPENRAPMANAGDDATVDAGESVMLDGSGSTDPESDELTYSWTLEAPMGSSAVLDDASSATPGFTADMAGSYVAVLVVNDGTEDSSTADEVVITAEEAAQAPDGEMLYKDNCESCHRISFADAPNWTAADIQDAIDKNKGGMGSLDLMPEEIQAIADALAARP